MVIRFFATYRDITQCKSIDVPAQPDVLALLHLVTERWPPLREKLLSSDGSHLGAEAIAMVNGRHISHLQGVKTPLSETDIVALFPVVAGG